MNIGKDIRKTYVVTGSCIICRHMNDTWTEDTASLSAFETMYCPHCRQNQLHTDCTKKELTFS